MIAFVGLGVGAVLLSGLPIMVMAAAGAPPAQVCLPSSIDTDAVASVKFGATTSGLDQTQLQHAATIIEVGRKRGVSDRGVVVALATVLQESGLRVYANDGLGGDLEADQFGIARSLELPHEAVGTDHGSLGLFQQQWPWWGPMTTLMDPAASAGLFYSALARIPTWEVLPVTVAAQSVQHSGHPTAYEDDEPLARQLLAELGEGITGAATSTDCAATSGGGSVALPVPPGSGYVDQENFGATGDSWSSTHTGTDLSVACGTPVFAATSGTVRVLTDQSWAGPWLVQVATEPGRLTTWYAHMQSVVVQDASRVAAGQQLGEVGELGNAHGCHLHFEVHPHDGSIYEDPIDPTAWLAENLDTAVRPAR